MNSEANVNVNVNVNVNGTSQDRKFWLLSLRAWNPRRDGGRLVTVGRRWLK